ncbi:MAG TPA: hypothetical protein VFE19_11395 [Jatrophihabitantaceae bacterium]|jgi:uncharacterized membrane protein YeaQ/YmgE (transglycosylase-associated protein family)|nr:hypothetical protein [Jatrophihabitantaceae bacterium]
MSVVASQPAVADVRSDRIAQLNGSVKVIGVLAVVGALLGLVWQAWSPAGPAGAVLQQGIQADENEAFVGGDGRFALITVIVGLLAGVAAWQVRSLRGARGPFVALALVVGGFVGAALTEWVGYLVRGDGNGFACTAASGRCIDHLPLTVHMHALLLAEAIAAVLVYSLFVAFAVDDDLGRPDPGRRARGVPVSVWPEPDPQQTWGYRDSSGPA